MQQEYDFIVIGGGAAGFFAALAAKESCPEASVLLLEKTGSLLSKVRVSGGGRCNVTHSCFDPKLLAQNYPRGGKALIGPFTRFQPADTVKWFEVRGVELKTEPDGRMFPITDSSQTIIDCLTSEARKSKVEIRTKQGIEKVEKSGDQFNLTLSSGELCSCRCLLLATGSSPQGHLLAKSLGHSIKNPVPSLFTFNVPNSPLKGLEGISVEKVCISVVDSPFTQTGPLLITHWGFSGPAALKLSAWGARFLHEKNYRVQLRIQWFPDLSQKAIAEVLAKARKQQPATTIVNANPFAMPKNLWKRFLELSEIEGQKKLSDISNEVIDRLSRRLSDDVYQVEGKTTYKEEFVTCGGVDLDEVNFKTMESKLCPKLYFAGEILDIDGVTGGFNFQNAWTTGWLAGNAALQ